MKDKVTLFGSNFASMLILRIGLALSRSYDSSGPIVLKKRL